MLLGNSPVEQVHNAKLLGVVVDDRLAWTEHVNAVCRKVVRKIGCAAQNFSPINAKSEKTVDDFRYPTLPRLCFPRNGSVHAGYPEKPPLCAVEESC